MMNNQERKLISIVLLRSVLSILLEIAALVIFIILSSFLISINGGADLGDLRANLLRYISFDSDSNSWITGILISEITIIYLLKNLFGYSNVLYLNKIIARIQNRFSQNLDLKFFNLPYKDINSINTGEASAALVDSMNHVIAGRISFFVLGIVEILNIFTILIVLSSQNIEITMILFVFCLSLLLFTYKRLRHLAASNGASLYRSTIASRLYFSQGKDSISIFSLSGRIPFFLDNLNQERAAFTESYLKAISLQQLPKYLIESYLLITIFFLYWIAQIFQTEGSSSLFILLFFLAGIRILPSITRLQSLWLGIADSKHRVETFNKITAHVDINNSKIPDSELHRISMPAGVSILRIVGDNLNFYHENKHVIKSLSFVIYGASSTLIKGASGSGKTTLLNLISGLLKPSSGSIKYFLSDGSIFDADSIPYRIGYVPQHPIIFKGSIARNVMLTEILDEESKACFEESMRFVDGERVFQEEQLEKEFIEAGGSNLSGGERQRINIARGIALQSKLLVMDEPTNSLDTDSSMTLIKGIRDYSMQSGKILILTTHQNELHSLFEHLIDLEFDNQTIERRPE